MGNKESRVMAAGKDGDTEVVNTLKRVCKACSEFRTWAKQAGVSFQICERSDCPVDKEELGRQTWTFLHTMAAYFPDKPNECEQESMEKFMQLFAKFYPCSQCTEDLKAEIKKNPPNVASGCEFAQWMCRLHNTVNRKMGKSEYDCKLMDERWRDGWRDGSCDSC